MENRIGFGARFGAALIDMVIVLVLVWLIGGTVAGIVGMQVAGEIGDKPDAAAAAGLISGIMAWIGTMALVLPLLGVIYFLIEGVLGATPGKMILGIKIGTADGKQGNIALYLKRWAIKNVPSLLGTLIFILALFSISDPGGIINIISGITALILFIGAFLIFGASKQCLHDKLAATAIYKRSDLTAG